MPANPVKTLLSQDNHSLLMIDHQCLQMLTIRSHNASELINNAVALPTHSGLGFPSGLRLEVVEKSSRASDSEPPSFRGQDSARLVSSKLFVSAMRRFPQAGFQTPYFIDSHIIFGGKRIGRQRPADIQSAGPVAARGRLEP